MATVKFTQSRDGGAMVYVDGRISFPERSGKQPEIGDVWEVEISGQNSKGTVNFLRLVRKVELAEWSWNDRIGNRSRCPACLIITPQGSVYRFTGQDIEGVVKVVSSKFTKQGKWSYTVFNCISPEGTKIYSWRQSWEEGVFWPQSSWEEAIAAVQEVAPQVKPEEIEAIIREHWNKAAEKFDENQEAMQMFAGGSGGQMEWSWNNGIASRSRHPACLIITPEGDVYRFTGQDIEGVVKVLKEKYEKNGKWSNTTYQCVSPSRTVVRAWRQGWDDGLFWPEHYWEDAIVTVQAVAPHALPEETEAMIRKEWPKVAERFDETRAIVLEATSTETSHVSHFTEWRDMKDVLDGWEIKILSGDSGNGVSGIQENILLPGGKSLLAISIGPGGGKRYGFEKIAEEGITRLMEASSRPYTKESVLAMVDSPEWRIAWTEYKDDEITSYALANEGGIHRFQIDGKIFSDPWKDIEVVSPSKKDFEEVFGKIAIPEISQDDKKSKKSKETFNNPFEALLSNLEN